ncbi:hypothetical protein [Sphingopyxis sp. BSNA05]|uniref:hypothetical protein n=1 Tax=Sphingopyxis sp. BSNA05 TaxID=1236614 RepID=UPI001C273DD0|nr:hypothetical protein [Sphingopyxis sp. BSNA05]
MKNNFGHARRSAVAALACSVSLAGLLAAPAHAQDGEQAADSDEVIVVTGFRGSLNAALDEKRLDAGVVDVIKAEDIADFPDLNLAESLQRIPGVRSTVKLVRGAVLRFADWAVILPASA